MAQNMVLSFGLSVGFDPLFCTTPEVAAVFSCVLKIRFVFNTTSLREIDVLTT